MNDSMVIQAMIKYGGGFVKRLGTALNHADADNLDRAKKAWPEYWKRYGELAGNPPEIEQEDQK